MKKEDNGKTYVYREDDSKNYGNFCILSQGEEIELRDKKYTIIDKISEGTGEANVYKIKDEKNNIYALKLYREFDNFDEEPNYESLSRIKNINDPDLLKIIDFGVGLEKYKEKYCYEILEYAQGGNLLNVKNFKEKYNPEFLEKEVIPQIFNAIKKLHDYKIYHCDLKPSNIFYKDIEQKDLIIGDFGSSKAYDLESEKAIRKSKIIKGTEFYLAPEQARGIISEKNDYYSLGMILLHLLYPDIVCKDGNINVIDNEVFDNIVERQYNFKPIINYNPTYQRLNTLIEGLTLLNHKIRWGREEIENWLKNIHQTVVYHDIDKTKYFSFGRLVIKNEEDFVNFINTNNYWYEDIFEDEDVLKNLTNWLDSYLGIPKRKRFLNIIQNNAIHGQDILKIAIEIFLLNKPLYVKNKAFNFYETDDISKLVKEYLLEIDKIYPTLNIEELKIYFFNLEFTLLKIINEIQDNVALKSILQLLYNPITKTEKFINTSNYKTNIPDYINSKIYKEKCIEYVIKVFYLFNPERNFLNPERIDDSKKDILKELAILYLQDNNLYDEFYNKLERKMYLERNKKNDLISLELKEFIFEVLKSDLQCNIILKEISIKEGLKIIFALEYFISEIGPIKEKVSLNFIDNRKYFNESIYFLINRNIKLFENFLHEHFEIKNIKNSNLNIIQKQLMKTLLMKISFNYLIITFVILMIVYFFVDILLFFIS